MEERKNVIVAKSKQNSVDPHKSRVSDNEEVVLGATNTDPRLRIQDSERTEYVAPVSLMYPTS